MADFEITVEEREASELIERRADTFIKCMSRVAVQGRGDKSDTCPCCGYPYLYYDMDVFDDCVICGWSILSGDELDDCHFLTEIDERPLTLARARLNYIQSGSCFDRGHAHFSVDTLREELGALVGALDGLAADTEPQNDGAHWLRIREAFNTLAFQLWPNPGRMKLFAWEFAAKFENPNSYAMFPSED